MPKINRAKVELVATCGASRQFPAEKLPEACFVGRSNVGKSSLINRLLGRSNLARVSSQPGKTRTVNFFEVDKAIQLVDLPGYGYAAASKEEQAAWGRVIENYLKNRKTLKKVFLLLDMRHAPTKDDLMMWDWLTYYNAPVMVIATKVDKLSRNERPKAIRVIRESLEAGPDVPIVPFSAETGEGAESIWSCLEEL